MGTPITESKSKVVRGVGFVEKQDFGYVVHLNDETYRIQANNAPAGLPHGSMFIEVNEETLEVYGFRPVNANVGVRFKQFGSRGETDTPSSFMTQPYSFVNKQGKKQTIPPKEKFLAILEVVQGQFTGAEIPHFLYFWPFEIAVRDDGTNVMAITGMNTASGSAVLDLLRYAGYDFEKDEVVFGPDVPADNPLPALEKILQSRNGLFMCKINDRGYTDLSSLSPWPDGMPRPGTEGGSTPNVIKVAGTTIVEGAQEAISRLDVGDPLLLVPEPDNEADPNAVRINTMDGATVGYMVAADAKRLYDEVPDLSAHVERVVGGGDKSLGLRVRLVPSEVQEAASDAEVPPWEEEVI